jgi:hypothetical protein
VSLPLSLPLFPSPFPFSAHRACPGGATPRRPLALPGTRWRGPPRRGPPMPLSAASLASSVRPPAPRPLAHDRPGPGSRPSRPRCAQPRARLLPSAARPPGAQPSAPSRAAIPVPVGVAPGVTRGVPASMRDPRRGSRLRSGPCTRSASA